jgi:hypothetical protein
MRDKICNVTLLEYFVHLFMVMAFMDLNIVFSFWKEKEDVLFIARLAFYLGR